MFCPRCHRRYEDDALFCPHDGDRLVDALDIRRIRSQPTEEVGLMIAGRYQVRGLIGKGAMARVYLAQDATTGTPVAVKVLEARVRREPKVRARFLLEAKAAATVVHPSIVGVIDIGLHEGAPYLVMELLFGESFASLLMREKKMTPERGLPFIQQIAEGLGAAHRAGVVHRDIKPANVFLVGEKGAPYAAKVVDFGFAKLNEHSGLTQAGVTVGTIEYMAPEQTVSDLPDARTDVYGLGILMYRVFSGRLPFPIAARAAAPSGSRVSQASEEAMTLARQLITPPDPPALGDGAMARALGAVILKALRKRPENRYASMDALLEDLGRMGQPDALAARAPVEESDVYEPRAAFSRDAARFLYKRLGMTLPEG